MVSAVRSYTRSTCFSTGFGRTRYSIRSFTAAFDEPSRAGSRTAFSTVSRDRLFSCLRWCICIATPPRGRIAIPGVKANNAFDRPAGSHSLAAAGQCGR